MRLQFFFELASTYSYPAAMRIESLAAARGVALDWRPFLLGPIFREQGWSDSPFNLYPAKGRYMWRDLERICRSQGIPFRRPGVFPRNGLLAARVCCAAQDAPWLPALVRALYRANFAEDRDIGRREVLADCLRPLGRDAEEVLERAGLPETKARLRAHTDEARRLGIFGAPSFVCGDELFWGNDRLEAALDWSASRAGAP